MSFSSACKAELCKLPLTKPCCQVSLLCGLYQSLATLHLLGRSRISVQFTVKNYAIARYIYTFCKKNLAISPQLHFVKSPRFGGFQKCIITIGPKDAPMVLERLDMLRIREDNSFLLLSTAPRTSISKNCCIK